MDYKCISGLTPLRHTSSHDHCHTVYPQIHSITILECIAKFTRSQPPSLSPNWLDYHLPVHLQTQLNKVLEFTAEFPQLWLSVASQIALNHGMQLVLIYHVLMGSYVDILMRIQTAYMSCKHCWTISSSNNFQENQQHSQKRCGFAQTALRWLEVLPDLSLALWQLLLALPGAPKVISCSPRCSEMYQHHSHGTPVPVIRNPSHTECWLECTRRVWYSPEIDPSKVTLHILSDTPGGFQWWKYILLMPQLLSPLSSSFPTLPSPDTTKLIHHSLLPPAMIRS